MAQNLVAYESQDLAGEGDVPIQRAKPMTSATMPALVETLSSDVLALLDEMASSEGVPRSFVVSAAIKALYRSLTWR
jgi:hypothetical protein